MTRGARRTIVAYLTCVAEDPFEATVLTERERMIVGWCAHWIEGRLDVKWARDRQLAAVRARASRKDRSGTKPRLRVVK